MATFEQAVEAGDRARRANAEDGQHEIARAFIARTRVLREARDALVAEMLIEPGDSARRELENFRRWVDGTLSPAELEVLLSSDDAS